MFAAVGNVQQHIRAGKLKALGVTSPHRLAALPDVPAIGETLPNFESNAWFGLFAPAKLPADVTRAWSDAARAAVLSPDVRRRIEAEGATVVGNTPQEFSRFVVADIARWREVVKFSGAKPE
jgi:tripartite-type tricarboxylate transporter receptor subunit TctC